MLGTITSPIAKMNITADIRIIITIMQKKINIFPKGMNVTTRNRIVVTRILRSAVGKVGFTFGKFVYLIV